MGLLSFKYIHLNCSVFYTSLFWDRTFIVPTLAIFKHLKYFLHLFMLWRDLTKVGNLHSKLVVPTDMSGPGIESGPPPRWNTSTLEKSHSNSFYIWLLWSATVLYILYISGCFQLPVGPDVPLQLGQNGCRLSLRLRYELLQELSGREYSCTQNALVSDSYIHIPTGTYLRYLGYFMVEFRWSRGNFNKYLALLAGSIVRILLGGSHPCLSVFSVGLSKSGQFWRFFILPLGPCSVPQQLWSRRNFSGVQAALSWHSSSLLRAFCIFFSFWIHFWNENTINSTEFIWSKVICFRFTDLCGLLDEFVACRTWKQIKIYTVFWHCRYPQMICTHGIWNMTDLFV